VAFLEQSVITIGSSRQSWESPEVLRTTIGWWLHLNLEKLWEKLLWPLKYLGGAFFRWLQKHRGALGWLQKHRVLLDGSRSIIGGSWMAPEALGALSWKLGDISWMAAKANLGGSLMLMTPEVLYGSYGSTVVFWLLGSSLSIEGLFDGS
jgi:hypothetical protein